MKIVEVELAGGPDLADLSGLPNMDEPAVSRYGVTAPNLRQRFENFNRGWDWEEQVNRSEANFEQWRHIVEVMLSFMDLVEYGVRRCVSACGKQPGTCSVCSEGGEALEKSEALPGHWSAFENLGVKGLNRCKLSRGEPRNCGQKEPRPGESAARRGSGLYIISIRRRNLNLSQAVGVGTTGGGEGGNQPGE
jgi:hypothetical protein